jgi:hypothetical protein
LPTSEPPSSPLECNAEESLAATMHDSDAGLFLNRQGAEP